MEDITKLLEELKPIVKQKREELKKNNMKLVKKEANITKKEEYEISEFTQYSGHEFINHLFQLVLNRNPEKIEYENISNSMLTLSKIEILINIRYSEEGKKNNVNILGLKNRYFYYKLNKIPILGYLTQLIITFCLLPKLLKKIDNTSINTIKKEPNVEKQVIDKIEKIEYEIIFLKKQFEELDKSKNNFEIAQNKINAISNQVNNLSNETKLFKKVWFNNK